MAAPCGIVAADGSPVHQELGREAQLSIRTLKSEAKGIDRALVGQLAVLSVIREDTGDAATASAQGAGESVMESNLDN